MAEENQKLDLLNEKEGLDAFELLDERLARARQDGILAAHPQTGEEDENCTEFLDKSRIKAIRTRLFLMGYLNNIKPEKGDDLRDSAYFDGVIQFQKEAGLKPDKWVGPKTWRALAQLVGFEEDTHLTHWIKPQFRSVLNRAMRLRLKALGFWEPDERHCFHKQLYIAAHKFIAQYNGLFGEDLPMRLGMHDHHECPNECPEPDDASTYFLETLQALFDQEALVSKLANMDDSRLGVFSLVWVHPLLVCIARVELWLLGYNCSPDGSNKMDKDLCKHVEHFLECYDGKKFRGKIVLNRDFFKKLDLADENEQRDVQDLVNEMNQNQEMADTVWGNFKKLGNRLWDGVKRATRFVGRLLKRAWKAVKKVGEWVSSAARALYGTAVKAFEQVKTFGSALRYSLEVLFLKPVPGNQPPMINIKRDGDYDLRILIDPNTPPARVTASMEHFSLAAKLLNATTLVMATLLELIRKIATGILKGAGWLGLIMALVRIWPKLEALASGFHETVSIFKALKALENSSVNA